MRQLRKSLGFTLLAVLTLAIGIGMNTAIFSLIQDLFLRGLPFSEPNRLVRIYGEAKERDLKQLPFSVPKFWHYRDGQNVFSAIAADAGNGFILTGMGEPAQILGGNVTANYFELLGIHPILGRNFLPEEETEGDVVMVTEGFWRKHFNSDPRGTWVRLLRSTVYPPLSWVCCQTCQSRGLAGTLRFSPTKCSNRPALPKIA